MIKVSTLLALTCVAFLGFATVGSAETGEAAATRVNSIAKQLNLTPQQEAEVRSILQTEAPKFDALKQDKTLSGPEKVKKLAALFGESQAALDKVLTPAQQKELKALRDADRDAIEKASAQGPK